MLTTKELFARRRQRTRTQIRIKSAGRPRLSVFRSGKHIYAQIIDDGEGRTIAAASSIEKDMRGKIKTGADVPAAREVGLLLAERAKAAGVENVVFDRGGYPYHGRVKALAEAAREGGLSF
ncbi:LSU ribosomal protein L18P [Stella humosa]|uniref:Large ribosomal subunit protein uL18 n=1 Tax=Stella humosa TaxID=94 RepID=A0A3N1MA32_9PROT|nr:50S ribosomal protein L18 [Stella humosa]ROQ00531.1 LSU ribosomal protein L18P [Stella humosa]BBK30225.1 50S ribosomal protein L18 [Stella humosa]